MYKRRPFSQKEQDYILELRNRLEEAEKMLLKIGPCRERSLALTKLDEALLWASVAVAESGVAAYEQ